MEIFMEHINIYIIYIMYRFILTILVGVISGTMGGAFGLGPILMLPGILLFGVISDYKTAVGTVILSMLPPISILAAIEYYKKKQVDINISILLCIAYFFGAYFGSIINGIYNTKTLEYVSSFLFLLISIYFFYRAIK
jgi:uncharacterized protein